MYKLILLSFLICTCTRIGAQVNEKEPTCICDPPCTSSDAQDCKSGVLVPRGDCPCCKVCLRQEGDSCGAQDPCDVENGIVCSSKGICEAIAKCKTDTDCPDDRFCIKDMCADPCSLLQPCLGSLKGGECVTKGHQPTCRCPQGTEENKELKTCIPLEGGFKPSGDLGDNFQKSSKFGNFDTRNITHNSTILKLPSSSGGTIHYKESRSNADATRMVVESGKSSAELTGLLPSTKYTIKWAGNDKSSGKTDVKTLDGCLHDNLSFEVGAKWHEECLTTCMCHVGGVTDCRPRCVFVAGAIQDEQCSEKPASSDPECCVEYDCKKKDNSVIGTSPEPEVQHHNQEREPKLIVTARSHNSVTVAWDDFRAENPERRYVTEYRIVPDIEINSTIPWMKKETIRGQPPPTMMLGNLKPNTLYEVRVGIYNQAEERRLIAATETITVRTEPGCVYGNTSFPVGEFFQGCEERCSCSKDGSVKCSERCSIPYFRKGSFSNDPWCTEETEEGDDCCVLVKCAHGGNGVVIDYDQCANTVCGKNAECVSWPSLNEANHNKELPQPGSCRCKEGFSGNPNDPGIGCVQDPDQVDDSQNCIFRSTSYSPGDVFNDGCQYKCTCTADREIECKPRCQYSVNETQPEEKDSSCTFLLDPNDECCQIRVCTSAEANVSLVPSPSLDFDGCIYQNKSYSKNEEFFFGCDSKCLCMGFGDVSCSPRCPPVKEMPKKEGVLCETLLDPEDNCCNVTVCDNTAQDVFKADIEVENITTLSIDDQTEVEENDLSNNTIGNDAKMNEKSMENTSMNSTDGSDMLFETKQEMEDLDIMKDVSNETKMMVKNMEMEVNDTKMDESNAESNISVPLSSGNESFFDLSGRSAAHDEKSLHENTLNPHERNSNNRKILFGIQEDSDNVLNDDNNINTSNFLTESDNTENKMKESNIEDNITSDSKNDTVLLLPIDTLQKKPRFDDVMIPPIEIISVVPEDESVVKMTVQVTQEILLNILSSASEFITVSYSSDSFVWMNKTVSINDINVDNMNHLTFMIPDLEGADTYDFKVYYRDMVSPNEKISLLDNSVISRSDNVLDTNMCSFDGKTYKVGESFYIGCKQFCECTEDVEVYCNEINCPSHSGLDIMDPGCIEFENDTSYVPTPPRCCGHVPKCVLHVDHLACEHMGRKFKHLEIIPKEFVGCDQRCQCLSGNLDCESLCSPVEALPPFHLPCTPDKAISRTASSFPCCTEWVCRNDSVSEGELPDSHINIHKVYPPLPPEPELSLVDVRDVTENSARILFNIAAIFVGLPGGIYLRYTENLVADPNPLNWRSEVIHEDGVIMSRMEWEYVKRNLKPGTDYSMQLALFTHLKRTETVSEIFTVSTLPGEMSTPLPHLDLDAMLSVSEVRNTSAIVSWKRFSEFELQYIDGVRVRFWPDNKKFPMEGPMLHREANNMILRNLLPGTKYTVDLFFIPHDGLTTSISNIKNITFMTQDKPKDKYDFDISIQIGKIKKGKVQILYTGVPEPEGKYVNVYRVVYTTDGDLHDSEKFRLPKNRKEGFISITDLKPGVVYEAWLEAFLTNGQKKKSNVVTVQSEPGALPTPEKSEIGDGKAIETETASSYYSAFVAMIILVIIACCIIAGLVMVLFRRQNKSKGHINSKTVAAAYDNPSYKSSDHPGYAMEMNGIRSSANGSSRSEEP